MSPSTLPLLWKSHIFSVLIRLLGYNVSFDIFFNMAHLQWVANLHPWRLTCNLKITPIICTKVFFFRVKKVNSFRFYPSDPYLRLSPGTGDPFPFEISHVFNGFIHFPTFRWPARKRLCFQERAGQEVDIHGRTIRDSCFARARLRPRLC